MMIGCGHEYNKDTSTCTCRSSDTRTLFPPSDALLDPAAIDFVGREAVKEEVVEVEGVVAEVREAAENETDVSQASFESSM